MSRGWFVGSAARASPVRLRHFRRAGGRQGEGAPLDPGCGSGFGAGGGPFPLPTIREGGGVVVDASTDTAAVDLRGMRGTVAVPDPETATRGGVHRCPGVADTAPVGVPGPSMRRPTPHPVRSTPRTVPRLAAFARTTQRVAAPQPGPWWVWSGRRWPVGLSCRWVGCRRPSRCRRGAGRGSWLRCRPRSDWLKTALQNQVRPGSRRAARARATAVPARAHALTHEPH